MNILPLAGRISLLIAVSLIFYLIIRTGIRDGITDAYKKIEKLKAKESNDELKK